MARTKASVGSKVAAGKSSKARCSVAPAPSGLGTSGSSDRGARGSTGGGNPVCQRETPKWQRPITNFFINKDGDKKEDIDVESDPDAPEAGTSNHKPKRNIIESDDEDVLSEKPKNNVLDESIHLEPLDGEGSHKIEEYYGSKGKGVGKKTKGKENRRQSKRLREDEEESESSKKVRVD